MLKIKSVYIYETPYKGLYLIMWMWTNFTGTLQMVPTTVSYIIC